MGRKQDDHDKRQPTENRIYKTSSIQQTPERGETKTTEQKTGRGRGRMGAARRCERGLILLREQTVPQGKMATDGHFRRYRARMRVIAAPAHAATSPCSLSKIPRASRAVQPPYAPGPARPPPPPKKGGEPALSSPLPKLSLSTNPAEITFPQPAPD